MMFQSSVDHTTCISRWIYQRIYVSGYILLTDTEAIHVHCRC